jgi:hypothetical protein
MKNWKKFGFRQLVILLLATEAAVFSVIGFTKLGFWDPVDGPKPGFFPAIMATVMFFVCVIAFVQSFQEDKKVVFTSDEFLVIGGGAGLIASVFLVGLVPSILIFVLIWMRIIERSGWKETILVMAISAAIAVGVFQLWLGIRLPMGIFENLF